MTEDQLHQIDQARRYAEQDEYVATRTHIRNLLAIIEAQPSVPSRERIAAIHLGRMNDMIADSSYTMSEAMADVDAMLAAGPEAPKS